jgi:SAM-dependent methyltransferase
MLCLLLPCLDSSQPLSDLVSKQYEEWVYPEPILDLPQWLEANWQWFDPSHSHRLFWPDQGYRADIDILVAGCGTNQAAVLAFTNPLARVVGIDVSRASLSHQELLKEKYSLNNLELCQMPIEDIGSLSCEYDLIVSTGVLHHLADPVVGMRALARCLRPDGVVAIMLYAHYGRIGVELMQAVFREIGLKQAASDLFAVKEAVALLPDAHPLRSYLSNAPDLQFDAGLVDTFLHGRDRSYTVDDCLDLVDSAGLVFQGWFLKSPYEPPLPPGGEFYSAVGVLPDRQRWGVMERINTNNACHFFVACRADRPLDSYAMDLDSSLGLDLVPCFRHRCGLDGSFVYRSDWGFVLSGCQKIWVSLIDGRRSILEIVTQSALADVCAGIGVSQLTGNALIFFRSLVNRDFIALGIRR